MSDTVKDEKVMDEVQEEPVEASETEETAAEAEESG